MKVSNASWFKQRVLFLESLRILGMGVPFLRFTLLNFLLRWVGSSSEEDQRL